MNRADLFVYLALVVAWAAVAAWAFRIARKANRLEAIVNSAESSKTPTGGAS
jgi:hypothetical protein